MDNPLVGCLALIGAFVVFVWLLSTFWATVIAFGPFGFAFLLAIVFCVGFVVGAGTR